MQVECIRCGHKEFSSIQMPKNWLCPNCEQELSAEAEQDAKLEAEIDEEMEARADSFRKNEDGNTKFEP